MSAMRAAVLLALLTAPCAAGDFSPSPFLRFDLTPAEIHQRCGEAQARAEARLSAVAADAPPTFEGTAVALDTAISLLGDETAAETFLKDVAVSADVRQASVECATALAQFRLDVYSREDLFRAVRASVGHGKPLTGEDRRLVDKQLRDFERNGLALAPPVRETLKRLRRRIVEIEQQFAKNVAEAQGGVWLTSDELAGMPADYRVRLRQEGGKFFVTTRYPDYFPFMNNATNAEARRRLTLEFNERAAAINRPLLAELLRLRREAARLRGYRSHADYRIVDNVARNSRAVEQFLHRLTTRLQVLGRRELAEMSALKRKDVGPHGDARIYAWDWRYYDNQIRKQRYDVDDEKVKEYFPLETVRRGLFDVYEQLFGLSFRRVPEAATWHPDVELFEVREAAGGEPIAYFYMDLFPREGKYTHVAEFGLVGGVVGMGTPRPVPVAAIVGNFTPPAGGRPSLLTHGVQGDVETLFHEFGHVMHELLTRARYGRFAGTNTSIDFVEAPSQMLQDWVWKPEILSRISGRWDDPSQKLPPDLLAKLVAVKNLNSGLRNLRQLVFGTVDLAYHSARPVDTTEVWRSVARKVGMIPLPPDTHPEASFSHIADGYDAGYYGYLWSQVYAEDMFTRFQAEGLRNPETGRRFRDIVLAAGGSREPLSLVEEFLGRKPSEEPLLRSMGLETPPAAAAHR